MTENEIKGNLKLMELETDSNVRKETLKNAIDLLKEIQQYQALGTVEELRVAKEKQIPKKPKDRYKTKYVWDSAYCPICNCGITARWVYCQCCGQKLDWSDKE